MIYKKIVEAIFLNRPNRFIAQVLIGDKEETVHVKSTGRLTELLTPGTQVILEDCSYNHTRKTKYSLIAVWKGEILVNVDSQVPNDVVYTSLLDKKIPAFKDLLYAKKEVTFHNSRFDLYFEQGIQKGFIEVKGVTLENDGIARFPGAPTSRGTKHVLEMIEAVKEGYRGILFFLIQMKGPELFGLNWSMDKTFSETVKLAVAEGVEIIAYDSIVSENSIQIGHPIEIDLDK